MNAWFQDARAAHGEAKTLEAERAQRRNQLELAHALYLEAAESFVSVAFAVPLDYPNTRGDLAVAAVACFGRGQAFGRAVRIAQQFLVEPDGISQGARQELSMMARDFGGMTPAGAMLAHGRIPTRIASDHVRRDVRATFKRKTAA